VAFKKNWKMTGESTSRVPDFTIGRWLTDGIMMLCKYN